MNQLHLSRPLYTRHLLSREYFRAESWVALIIDRRKTVNDHCWFYFAEQREIIDAIIDGISPGYRAPFSSRGWTKTSRKQLTGDKVRREWFACSLTVLTKFFQPDRLDCVFIWRSTSIRSRDFSLDKLVAEIDVVEPILHLLFFRRGRTIARTSDKHHLSRYVGWQMPIVALRSDCAEWTPYLRSNCGSVLTFLHAVATLAAKTNNWTPSAIPLKSSLAVAIDELHSCWLLIFYV